ncbi:protein of unknown function (plasmid) [Azospirillum lipoferum 4B]|uniref:Uncharacterized protein n=1 Tax=Azospirillum lipoferum (strain 4B) TaxID=862719 RepID=G7ZED9_AZOL4|nr:protein of unknown function [Azospirillum lipoferum 4B]
MQVIENGGEIGFRPGLAHGFGQRSRLEDHGPLIALPQCQRQPVPHKGMVVDDQELDRIGGQSPAVRHQFLHCRAMGMLCVLIHLCSLSFVRSAEAQGTGGLLGKPSTNSGKG